jgi:hypothetical protein
MPEFTHRIDEIGLRNLLRGRILDYFVASRGGTCGGLVLCSSRHNPQGNGLPCLGHLVALIALHLGLALSVTFVDHHDI